MKIKFLIIKLIQILAICISVLCFFNIIVFHIKDYAKYVLTEDHSMVYINLITTMLFLILLAVASLHLVKQKWMYLIQTLSFIGVLIFISICNDKPLYLVFTVSVTIAIISHYLLRWLVKREIVNDITIKHLYPLRGVKTYNYITKQESLTMYFYTRFITDIFLTRITVLKVGDKNE